ncbi:MAG: cell division protein FtsA [Tindallia sp. MSAO_Bac2]|nr:MAG: cell division protein FtsA [Tindallia sp. MSAO_Bac2]
MNQKENQKEMMLALDIGTRSVIGLLGSLEDQKVAVHHKVVVYHENRAMFDGQIHDIEEVSRVIGEVKHKLEYLSGTVLEEATIAAAGRALQTESVTADLTLDPFQSIKRSHIQQVELKALQAAEKQLEKANEGSLRYFCVGHSIIQFYLDGSLIKNPLNHKGEILSVQIIATFLPKLVVDSLYASVTAAGLDVNYLTLEPIAAIEVAVPENARLLNIALVDIGAGTSDIAITKNGTIHAYAMTDVAGDELTESLAQLKMLDFDNAEFVKCQITNTDKLEYEDILGIKHQESSKELLELLLPSMQEVAAQITEAILKHNGKAPSAVFLIGGGSQTKLLPEMISKSLNLPTERVSVRNLSNITNLNYYPEEMMGPEGITPIGILKKALLNRHNDFIEITINGQPVKLFQTRKLCIRDGLAALQYNPHQLVPRRGASITVTVNDEEKVFPGEFGLPATITRNNETANLETELNNGDQIIIKPATIGDSACVRLYSLLNEEVDMQSLFINGNNTSENKILKDGDEISFNFKKNLVEKEIEDDDSGKKRIEIKYNGNPFIIETCKEKLIFVDLFDYIDFDRTEVKGELVLLHNGTPAAYVAPINPNDEIWIYWKKEDI